MIATYKKPVTENKKLVNAALRSALKWDTIPWDHHRTIVKKLQLRIAKTTNAYVKPSHQYKRWLKTGLSRMMGNYHVRFLGGERAAMRLATRYNQQKFALLLWFRQEVSNLAFCYRLSSLNQKPAAVVPAEGILLPHHRQ